MSDKIKNYVFILFVARSLLNHALVFQVSAARSWPRYPCPVCCLASFVVLAAPSCSYSPLAFLWASVSCPRALSASQHCLVLLGFSCE